MIDPTEQWIYLKCAPTRHRRRDDSATLPADGAPRSAAARARLRVALSERLAAGDPGGSRVAGCLVSSAKARLHRKASCGGRGFEWVAWAPPHGTSGAVAQPQAVLAAEAAAHAPSLAPPVAAAAAQVGEVMTQLTGA